MTHIIDPNISKRHLQVVKGTILGGSSIVKPVGGRNCYLSMRSKNPNWLDYKASELSVFSSKAPFTIEKTNRWHSLCYPIFSDMRELFYANKKRRLNPEALNDLQDVAFMIWYGEVGSYNKGHIVFNTNIWGKKGTETIRDYFTHCGWEASIYRDRKSYRLKLSEDASCQLWSTISGLFPDFFNH